MFAIGHAATALVIKRRFPSAPLPILLLSVQLMELLWAALNLLGIEKVTTEYAVHSVADIHLAYMPWSHSVLTMVGAALLAWLVFRAAGRRRLGVAVGVGVASHLVLDLLTHAGDIALAPGMPGHLGLGLYGSAPMAAFFLELAYGVVCWRIFRGSPALLAVVVGFNAANISFFSAVLPGPEELLAGHPTALVLVVLAQIGVTLTLVGALARRSDPERILGAPLAVVASAGASARGAPQRAPYTAGFPDSGVKTRWNAP